MTTTRRAATLAIIIGLITAALALATPTRAQAADVDASPGRWATSTITVHAPGRLLGWKLTRAINAWNATGLVAITTTPVPCTDDVTGCITVNQTSPYRVPGAGRSWNGYASSWVWPDSGLLARCTVTLNNTTARKFRLPTLTHELGHCLGLPHSDVPWSVMNGSSLVQGPAPTGSDVSRLGALYAP